MQGERRDWIGRWGWLPAAVGVVVLLVAATVQKVWAGDTWWQLNTGRWIVEHGAVPRSDQFAFTSHGGPLVEVRWLYCVLLYLGWQVGGATPLILGLVAVTAATWAAIAVSCRRAMAIPLGMGVVALALVAGLGRWVLRPEMMTFLLAAVFLVLLDADGRRARRWTLWLIPALQVVWVNTHTVFILGPILVLTFALGKVATPIVRWVMGGGRSEGAAAGPMVSREDAREALRLAGLGVLTLAACVVSPYLHRTFAMAYEVWAQSRAGHVVARSIIELRSPLTLGVAEWRLDFWAMAALMALGARTFVLRARRLDAARLAVFAAGCYLALSAQRHIALMAVMVGFAALANLRDWLLERDETTARANATGAAARRGWTVLAHSGIGLACVWVGWYVATDRLAIETNAPRESGIGVVEWGTPRGAAEFILREKPSGNMFNTMRDGGYLAWRTGRKVYIDGRTDAYSEAFLTEFFRAGTDDWERLVRERGLGVAVFTNSGFESLLAGALRSPEWAVVHLDHRNIVLVRSTAENAGLVSRLRIDPALAWEPREAEPEERPAAWKRALGGPARPWFSAGMGETFWAIGDFADAARYYERALAIRPGDAQALRTLPAAHRNAGRSLLDRQRYSEALPHLRRSLELDTKQTDLHLGLAMCLVSGGDFAGAAREYEAYLSATPGAPASEWTNWALSLEKSGDLPKAARAYAAALERDPGQAAVWNQLGTVLARTGDMARARECFQRALAIRPDYRTARENLERAR